MSNSEKSFYTGIYAIMFLVTFFVISIFFGISLFKKNFMTEKTQETRSRTEVVIPNKEFEIRIKMYDGNKSCTTYKEKINDTTEKVVVICDQRKER